MESYIRVCMKSDWSLFCQVEDFDVLKAAMNAGEVIELRSLWNTRQLIDGGDISTLHISTPASRVLYGEFEKQMLEEEGYEEKESWQE